MTSALLFGNILAFAGIFAGIYYLVTSRRINTSAQTVDLVSQQVMKIIRRRRFGSSLMIVIAIMFMVATNWYSNVHTVRMSIFWLLLMLMLLWLLILAGIDLFAISRLRQQMIEQANNKIQKLINEKKENGVNNDAEKHDSSANESGDGENDKK